jgi:tetratricopeptide (TPR) repeat protein
MMLADEAGRRLGERNSMTRTAGRRRAMRMASALVAGLLGACTAPADTADSAPVVPTAAAVPISSPLGSYLAGRHAQQQHDYAAAAQYFGQALAQDPSDYELLNKTFLFDLSEGHVDEARVLALRITRTDAAAPLPNLVLLLGQLKAGDAAGADALAQTMPHEGLHRFVSPLIQAWTKVAIGQPDQGIAALAPLRHVEGFAPLADFHAGLIADYAGRPGEAEASYKKVMQPKVRASWRSIETLGGLYERTGRPEEAKALYDRFKADNPDSELVDGALARIAASQKPAPRIGNGVEGAAEALFDLASVLDQNETADLALIYARLAVGLRPDFPIAQLLVADILEGEHRPAEALEIDKSLTPQSPYYWSARLRAASNLETLDRTDDAIAELKAMAAARPERSEALIQLGDLYRGKNRFAEAVSAYDGAIARIRTPEPRHWGVFYSRGVALERSGDWPRAEADLLKALELQPDQPLVLNYLGYSWVDKGLKLKQAMDMIQRAVELRPNDGYIVDSLGWAFYRLGNYAQAAQHLEHAVELHPDDPTINDHLGDAYWQTGRVAEARNQWRRALQFGPEAAEIKTIEAKLDKGLQKPVPAAATVQGG